MIAPLLAEGWPDIVHAIKSARKRWPMSAIVYDLRWLRDRTARDGASFPTVPDLAARWFVTESEAKNICRDVGPHTAIDLDPDDAVPVPVLLTEEEITRLGGLDERLHRSVRMLVTLGLRALCPAGGQPIDGAIPRRAVCPTCKAILIPQDGKLPPHENRFGSTA